MNFQQATFLASYGTFSQLPPCKGMEIAFAGRSNVGKSTMLNKIFNRKALARVIAGVWIRKGCKDRETPLGRID